MSEPVARLSAALGRRYAVEREVWSPDGSYIAIAADLADQGGDMLLLPLGGSPAVLHRPGSIPTSWR